MVSGLNVGRCVHARCVCAKSDMSRFVDSFRNLFNREKCKPDNLRHRPNNRVTHADSFVYLPGEDGTSNWGEPLRAGKRENVSTTSNHLCDSESPSVTRRRTNTVAAVDAQSIRSSNKPFTRRLSGTIVALKSRRSDEVEDESVPEEEAERETCVNPYDTLASHSYASLEAPFGKRVTRGSDVLSDGCSRIDKGRGVVAAEGEQYSSPWQEVDVRAWDRLQWLQQRGTKWEGL